MKLYLIGGFLGSGKTTAVYSACSVLRERGIPVGVITNDQGNQLVDTRYFEHGGITTTEVSGGCFCCNYRDLEKNILSLTKANHSDVIFAESVGSCTDLVATVIKPLQQFYPQIEIVLSVFADASLLYELIQGSPLFVQNVNYIYKKQLDEADVLVINKTDLLKDSQMEEVKAVVKMKYPAKKVVYQNSLKRESIQKWLGVLNAFQPKARKSLVIDYDIYGSGEAELAWLDAQIDIYSTEQDAVIYGIELINKLYSKINSLQLSIGHLKFLIDDGVHQKKISFTSIKMAVLEDELVEFNGKMIKLLINARIQAGPGQIEKIITENIGELESQTDCEIREHKVMAFKPGYPRPTYRILN